MYTLEGVNSVVNFITAYEVSKKPRLPFSIVMYFFFPKATFLDFYFIRDAFINREHVVAVFLFWEKVYDSTWRYKILKDLNNFGLKGRLQNFIKGFLQDLTIQVLVESTLSDFYDQERYSSRSHPFNHFIHCEINDIIKRLNYKTDGFLCVDDFYMLLLEKYVHNRKTLIVTSKQN